MQPQPPDQVFRLRLALRSDGECVEHARPSRIFQRLALAVAEIGLAEDLHGVAGTAHSPHILTILRRSRLDRVRNSWGGWQQCWAQLRAFHDQLQPWCAK